MWTTDPATGYTVDLSIDPPWGPGNCTTRGACKNPCADSGGPEACPHEPRFDYAYDDPSYNWRALRVINSSHDFTFVQWDPEYMFGKEKPAPGPKHPTPAPGPPIKPAQMMPGVDIEGADSPHPCPAQVEGNMPLTCEATCKAKAGCLGWTLHYNQPSKQQAPGWRCCTKTSIHALHRAEKNTTSGILNPKDTWLSYAYAEDTERQAVEEAAAADAGAGAGTEGSDSGAPPAGNVTFSEYYDLKSDPWQMKNLWTTLDAGRQAALMAEIDKRFACTGTRDTPSNCE
jgi:hypothetical protein